MGNTTSYLQRQEELAFAVIRKVPLVNILYGATRAVVFGSIGDYDGYRATLEATSRHGFPGFPILSDFFDCPKFVKLNEIRDDLKPGDLIEFDRGTFSHYALFLGDDEVMNVNAEGKNKEEALITKKYLHVVCRGDLVRISNHDKFAMHNFRLKAKPVDEIIREAERYRKHGKVIYNFMHQNCEYYVTYWRFGKGFSTQVCRKTSTQLGLIPNIVAEFTILPAVVLSLEEQTAINEYQDYTEPPLTEVGHEVNI